MPLRSLRANGTPADGSCSWFEFATEIVARAGVECEVVPGKSEELSRPAPRPANSVLRSERGAPSLPHWHSGLAAYLGARVSS